MTIRLSEGNSVLSLAMAIVVELARYADIKTVMDGNKQYEYISHTRSSGDPAQDEVNCIPIPSPRHNRSIFKNS
ncbi:hypothetical protein T4E_3646 [Trichinella pseudospiralis]|uniref:Uncharacterized protein n=1 Tax=Trichinella pseudospiralis TaxID=6337 RepID=A0A0V0XIG1_TRIPS|nr:hypothetical protein T4E_3646 [Trichinella pseudospiralis]